MSKEGRMVGRKRQQTIKCVEEYETVADFFLYRMRIALLYIRKY